MTSAAETIIRRLPVEPGSYLFWLYLPRVVDIQIGRLGASRLRRGWYFYCGSAFGPSGLRARLGHHLQLSERRHWHIDYLKEQARVRALWFCRGVNLEHEWSRCLLEVPGACQPVAGFGSSDCGCPTHLVYLPARPAARNLNKILQTERPITRILLPS